MADTVTVSAPNTLEDVSIAVNARTNNVAVSVDSNDGSVLVSVGDWKDSFEAVSQNLKDYPKTLNYTTGVLTSIVYTFNGGTITKTLNYTLGILTSIVLSGDTPDGIPLTKTLTYSAGVLVGISYS